MYFKKLLETQLNSGITEIRTLGGGDINEVYLVKTPVEDYVLKVNYKDRFPDMFTKEAQGLQAMSSTGVMAPEVKACFESDKWQLLLLEYVEQENPGEGYWKNFGIELATLHRKTATHFGLEHDNYIGSLPQINKPKQKWHVFFAENRILPLVKNARDLGRLGDREVSQFESFIKHLSELLPEEEPSLLHGDLWSGNLLCGLGQRPVFIDPAVYFGHREVDLAMTKMFGGFDYGYIDIYQEIFPLEPGWQKRMEIYNIYPNLVHLVLFGRSYLFGIQSVLRHYS